MSSKLFSFLTIALLVCSNYSQAQHSVQLNENWEFLRQDIGGVWELVRPVGKGNPESVPLWTKVRLPHCVNAHDAVDPDLNYYQGRAWYRTQLSINNPYQNGRTLLHFEGAGQKTSVYVYDKLILTHTGGYDEFTADITEAVEAFKEDPLFQKQFNGKIPISICTDNSRDLEMIPSSLSDFNIYGGIYRYLNLVYVPEISFERLFVKAEVDKDGKMGRLSITPRFLDPNNKKISASLEIKVFDPSGKLVLQRDVKPDISGDTVRPVEFEIRKPRLWSTVSPELYKVEAVLRTDGIEARENSRIGFRHFEFVEQGPFLLNGKRLLLRGTHRHEDHAGVGAAMTEDMMRTEMMMMKEMGVNFIRLGHYQQSRIILDLCDSLGILVWEEIPWCRGGLGGEVYKEQARRMLRNMIVQHFNHPSVIIWGLGNENDWPGDFPEFDKEKIRVFMRELNDLSHALDPSRKTAIRRCDFCKDIVDVYSPSIWAGWYRGIYTEYKSVSEQEMKKVKHFLHVEWGGDSHAGRHAENPDNALLAIKSGGGADERAGDASLYGGAARVSKDGDWSESYICNLVDWHLKEQETMPWLTGTAQWPFKDFSTPVRPDNPVPYMNQKGVVERDFTKKEAYYVFQSYWTTKPMVHIYGHNWPVRWGNEGEEKMVKAYSNCDEAECFLNGRSLGIKKRNSQDFPAAGLRWKVTFNKGMNTVKVIARKGRTVVVDSVSFRYQVEKWNKPAQLKINKLSESNGITTIEATLHDANGVQCLDAADWIRFRLAGDGKLIDNQGTSSGSNYVQLYNGRAEIRVETNNGKSVISASVQDLPAAFIELDDTGGSLKNKVVAILREQIIAEANDALKEQPVTVTSFTSPRSAGGVHDFFSEGDYWWPNEISADSPYVQKDGLTNPDNFVAHRLAMIRFSRLVGSLTSAWLITGNEKYRQHALLHCRAWFVDTATRMNPSLLFAQAIKGRVTGRGIGIIDTIHLIEVVQALMRMDSLDNADRELIGQIRWWFEQYLAWLTTHQYGRDEMNAANNHGTCWVMQVAAFARFTNNQDLLKFCSDRYKNVLLPGQMAEDGSFPLELKRTKPYGYALFNLDAMVMICEILSDKSNDLWVYNLPDGRSIKKGIEYMYPHISDKSRWPFKQDVMYWNEWPVAQPSLLFGARAFGRNDWFTTWSELSHAPQEAEVIRNLPVRNPVIWLQ